MADTNGELRGVVRGKTIELETETGLPDGAAVEVKVRRAVAPGRQKLPPGEGLRRAFGAWAGDDEGLDEFLRWTYEQRKTGRPEIED